MLTVSQVEVYYIPPLNRKQSQRTQQADFFLIEKEQKYVDFALKRLENVKFIQSDIASAKFDEKPLKVSIDDMINAGFLFLDEKFYLKNTNEFAILKNGAKLEFNGEFYDIYSLAAKLKN